ncbi:hypothetical protein TNCT_235111 [Trichonephila clavata]|uniref:Uncharacterized protein n=1 Tax=Trichonephila clavata TaxID=2740835 RepID=A0A8X6M5D5_TRICU|nr:hypothetical protein TNCT_235111 [Trichonephila clavata]
MGKIITSTRRLLLFEQTPLGFREAFEDLHSFVKGVLELNKQLDIDFVPEPLVLSLDPTIDKGFRIRTELTQAVSNKKQNTSILSSLALETMETMYPKPDWMHIYTDGNLLKYSVSAGAEVYCHLFSFNKTTGKIPTARFLW